jgi:hypothetical protein
MKHLISKLMLAVAMFLFVESAVLAQSSELQLRIEQLPGVVSVTKIDHHQFFAEAYEIMIEQQLDHSNPAAGKFVQRVFLSDFNKYSPVIFVTEGYKADYAGKSSYINELSEILQANQIVVEHRYFGKSVPENNNWDYLTIENACHDLYKIQQLFKKIYTNNNKWIATGISKGGQNTIAYKAFYPNAVDVWIPYVAPVNFAVEDKRMQEFIANEAGNETCRQRVLDFQLNVLENRELIQPLLDSLIEANNYTYSITNDAVLDYCVLEYSFAFWQWGSDCDKIPADTVHYRNLFNHLINVSGPDYFSIEGTEPIKAFFIQAVKEFGYYGYNTQPLSEHLSIQSAKGYIPEVFLSGEPSFKYSKKTSKFIEKTIQKGGEKMILIYGENDPWTAGGIVPKKKSKAVRFVLPDGSHRARINNMSYAQRAELYMILEPMLEK